MSSRPDVALGSAPRDLREQRGVGLALEVQDLAPRAPPAQVPLEPRKEQERRRDAGVAERDQQVGELARLAALVEAEDRAQHDLDRDLLHARAERKPAACVPLRDVRAGDVADRNGVAAHPVARKRGDQEPPAPRVGASVGDERRRAAGERAEHREVRRAAARRVGARGEQLLDVRRRRDQYPVAAADEPKREDVAEALAAFIEQGQRIGDEAEGLQRRRRPQPGRQPRCCVHAEVDSGRLANSSVKRTAAGRASHHGLTLRNPDDAGRELGSIRRHVRAGTGCARVRACLRCGRT